MPVPLPSSAPLLHSVVREIERRAAAGESLTAVRHFPAREARFTAFPTWLDQRLIAALRKRGIEQLYTHQAEALEAVRQGRNLVVVTPTASGKTLCYHLPVLHTLLEAPGARAIYLYPTKALSRDQMEAWHELSRDLETDAAAGFVYDGDTPEDARRAIRSKARVVMTNPDMLHAGILPHHTKWAKLFENLRYVVLDELHTYRGVFGSHVANVLRRLKRIARFYGSTPRFICTSATIANPGELAAALLEEDITLIGESGAPSGERFFLFYNPPVVNRALGIRRSYVGETRQIALSFLARGLQTMVFANSRLITEILVTYLKEACAQAPHARFGRGGSEVEVWKEQGGWGPDSVRGYRGGYLPEERRAIEKALREGHVRAVVTTNALELGIDIGSLDVALLAGYPGTIASTWQRAGRAGRRSGASCAVLIASSSPLDQFMVQNPEYFFGQSPEHAYVHPDNLEILLNHLKCAAFELPLRPEGEPPDRFGGVALAEICRFLQETGYLHPSEGAFHWTRDAYPADAVSLRSVSSDNFVIIDTTADPRVIGEVDFTSALTTVHEKAIYLHESRQHHVERFDYQQRKAYVKQVDVDYFTDAISYTKVKILEALAGEPAANGAQRAHGEIQVNTQVVGFKKIKFYTLENVGAGDLQMPEQEMHTTAYWLEFPPAFLELLPGAPSDRTAGLLALAHALRSMATLLVMCDRNDLAATVHEAPEPRFHPQLFLYDNYPGGIGLSEALYRLHHRLLEQTARLISGCACADGCPSCVGPEGGKEMAQRVLELLR